MKSTMLIVLFLLGFHIGYSAEGLKVMVIFAHPDEGEIYTGGITALYTELGHQVKFMSLTNGDAGHYSMKPEDLAKRRYKEAMNAKIILGLSDYEVLDYHDGILKNTEEIQQKVLKSISEFNPDIVFTYYPALGGHNDNMTAGWIVRDAAGEMDSESLPVFIYVRDFHTSSFSYIPDFGIIIDKVWDTKLAACGAHESQVVEFNPQLEGVLDEVLASEERQKEFLIHNTYPYSKVTPGILQALSKWYGEEKASKVKYAEGFEIAEFGRQITDEEVLKLFPMISK